MVEGMATGAVGTAAGSSGAGGARRSQRHNPTPIAPESSIREAISPPTTTLLLGPASCLDAGPAFLCAVAFLGKTRSCAPHLYPSVNCERLDSLVITRAGRGGRD